MSIISQRTRIRTEEILLEVQVGFRKGRSAIDEIFTPRQLAEKYEEYSKHVYICYIDYRKAFNSVWKRDCGTLSTTLKR